MLDFSIEVDEIKTSGRYLNLKEEGSYKIRILGDSTYRIQGYEAWSTGKEGNRIPLRTISKKEAIEHDEESGPKVFWALVVYNYEAEAVQIWQFTQQTIKDALTELSNNEDWGHPTNYDITITRKGTTMNNTSYSITPSAPKKLSKEVEEAMKETPVNLMVLFDEGLDPFSEDNIDTEKLPWEK